MGNVIPFPTPAGQAQPVPAQMPAPMASRPWVVVGVVIGGLAIWEGLKYLSGAHLETVRLPMKPSPSRIRRRR